LVEDKIIIGDEVQKDLWDVIKTHPYVSRERHALPETHKDGIRAIKAGDIMTVEVENSIRSIDYLEEQGKCVDNIVPKQSTISHAGRGAFAIPGSHQREAWLPLHPLFTLLTVQSKHVC